MIEVFDAKRTRSYGCFASSRLPPIRLTALPRRDSSEVCPLSAWRRIKAACCNGNMKRCLSGKWRVPKSEKADAGNDPARGRRRRKWCKEYAMAGADVPRRVSRPFEPQLSALGGQPETVQPEMQNLYAIIKTQ